MCLDNGSSTWIEISAWRTARFFRYSSIKASSSESETTVASPFDTIYRYIRLMERLNEAGVPCGTYYPVPLHLQGAFAQLGYKEGDLPVTEELSRTTFAIPVFPELYDEERNYIISTLKKVLE